MTRFAGALAALPHANHDFDLSLPSAIQNGGDRPGHKAEQASLWAKVEEIDNRAGAKFHISCNSRWADEDIMIWGVIEYPSMEAYQKNVEELEALDWWRYFSGKTILGTKMEM